MTALDEWAVIADPDPDPCWLHKNVRVKGYVGEVDLPTDQYIRRPIDHIFQEACTTVRTVLPDGGVLEKHAYAYPTNPPTVVNPKVDVSDEECAHIVEVRPIDDHGSLLFKFKFWGVPER